MKKISIALYMMAACFIGGTANAQKEGTVSLKLDYGVGIPLGSFKSDVVNETSWRGYHADVLYNINDRWAAGIGTGFQDFYQKYPRQLYKASDGSDISAVMSYSIQTVPILAKGQFSFLPGPHVVKPYVAVGVGGNLITYRQFLGEYDGSKDKFAFAAAPELGVNVLLGKFSGVGINVAAGYNYMPFNYAGIDNLDNLAVKAGINIPLK